MKFESTKIPDVLLITPKLNFDNRGHFCVTYNHKEFEEKGIPNFVQDNQSDSRRGVLRGMHFQKNPNSQGKLVRVIKGSILDVAVDLRKKSPTYLEWVSVFLDDKSFKMLWIPPGFAHGFLTLEETTRFLYKCTANYHPESESGVRFNDPYLHINWELEKYGINSPMIKQSDLKWPLLKELAYSF